MSLASFWRRVQRTWRQVSQQLWPEAPPDPFDVQRAHLRDRLARLQAKMLTTRRSLSHVICAQRKKDRLYLHLLATIGTDPQAPEAIATALELERLREVIARLQTRREKLERRYQKLRERYHSSRQDLARLTR